MALIYYFKYKCKWWHVRQNEILSEGQKSWKFQEKKKAISYNFNWKKGNLTQNGGGGQNHIVDIPYPKSSDKA